MEKRNNGRERYALFILDTLENPYEIYKTKYDDGSYRNTYIALYQGKNNFICIVQKLENGAILWNVFNTDKKGTNKKRLGILKYAQE